MNRQGLRAAVVVVGSAVALFFLSAPTGAGADEARDRAVATIRGADLGAHVQELASDAYAGRMPATPGEEKTLAYLTARLRSLGVSPPPGGSYLQKVPLYEKTVQADTRMTLRDARGESTPLLLGDEMLVKTSGTRGRLAVEPSEIVFAGFGVQADEIGWDDYAGTDVRGKVVVALLNDPRGAADSLYFKGLALTHHGYTLSKQETAARLGARGLIIVHDQDVIGYPWQAIAPRATRPLFERVPGKSSPSLPPFMMTISRDAAEALFRRGGHDLAALTAAACERGFRAVPLGVSIEGEIVTRVRRSKSYNVVGWIKGSERPDEYVLYTAHWDHVGIGAPADGDSIYNGAVDNATGTAAVLELAEAYRSLPRAPRRSVVFIATTAEEQGLLGAYHYTDEPVFPLARTVGVINMDALFPFGDFNGMTLVAPGSSELEDYLRDAAAVLGRKLQPDPSPQHGAFFRSDHYPFAKRGVPAIFAVGGPLDDPAPDPAVSARFEDYMTKKYHQPADEYGADWDMRGIEGDVRIYFLAGYALANDTRVPNWYLGSEFRARRDAMRAVAAP